MALREYITSAHLDDGTQHVLLVGADTYDYFDYLGVGSQSFIPTPYLATDSIVRFAPVDPLYGDVDGDLAPEVSIGRWPVRTVEELDRVIDKTLRYGDSVASPSAFLAADRTDGLAFANETDRWADALPAEWDIERAYVDEIGTDAARASILSELEAGHSLTVYFGHSSPTTWSNDPLLTVHDALALSNTDPSVIVQWGCWNSYSVEPRYETLGPALLTGTDGGAAAVIGLTTLSQSTFQAELADLWVRYAAQPDETIGSALQRAKSEFAEIYPKRRDILLGVTLLGDPTLQLPQ